MTWQSGDLAHLRMNDYLREAERTAMVSKALGERKAVRRDRTARASLRPVRQAWVMVSSAVALLRP
jgi:hypothetical protein